MQPMFCLFHMRFTVYLNFKCIFPSWTLLSLRSATLSCGCSAFLCIYLGFFIHLRTFHILWNNCLFLKIFLLFNYFSAWAKAVLRCKYNKRKKSIKSDLHLILCVRKSLITSQIQPLFVAKIFIWRVNELQQRTGQIQQEKLYIYLYIY